MTIKRMKNDQRTPEEKHADESVLEAFNAGMFLTGSSKEAVARARIRANEMLESKPLAQRYEKMRDGMLESPNTLLGCAKPPIEAIWAYCMALTYARDIALLRINTWNEFIAMFKHFGSRTEFRVLLDDYDDFSSRITFLRDLYIEYESWCNNRKS